MILFYLFILVASSQALACCPLLCKSKASRLNDAKLQLDLAPVRPEVIAATAKIESADDKSFIFNFKTDNSSQAPRSVDLFFGITKKELKERIIKACGYSDYTNRGYYISIYNGSKFKVGLVEILNGDDKPVRPEVIEKIRGFEDSLVIVNLI